MCTPALRLGQASCCRSGVDPSSVIPEVGPPSTAYVACAVVAAVTGRPPMMQTSVKKPLRVTVYDTVSFWAIPEIVPRNAPDLAVWVGATPVPGDRKGYRNRMYCQDDVLPRWSLCVGSDTCTRKFTLEVPRIANPAMLEPFNRNDRAADFRHLWLTNI